jgi:hypothetical protein
MIIALAGPKGVGKNHFFNEAKSIFNRFAWKQIAFADPIKNNIIDIFNLTNENDYDIFKRSSISVNNNNIEGRDIVRKIGMLMRSYDENQFVNYVKNKIESDSNNSACPPCWVITDLRFHNEYELIKNQLHGKIIKIKNNNIQYDFHVSELEFDDNLCDFVFDVTNLSEKEYKRKLLTLLTKLLCSYF